MPRATLRTTIMLACLALALGCREAAGREAVRAPNTIERSTTIWAPPAQGPGEPRPETVSEPSTPAPAMSIPPNDETVESPSSSPERWQAPRRPPSQYVDGCGRPLVA